MIKWRRQYADPVDDERLAQESGIDFSGSEDLTVQSYKDDADINVMMRRFRATGEVPRPSVAPFYGDFAAAPDYRTSLDMIREAGEAFEQLPSSVRKRFANDPSELIAFLQDASNRDEAEELGLLRKKETPPAPPEEPKKGSKAPPKEEPPAAA